MRSESASLTRGHGIYLFADDGHRSHLRSADLTASPRAVAWWLLNDNPVHGGEVDLLEWCGNEAQPLDAFVGHYADHGSTSSTPRSAK